MLLGAIRRVVLVVRDWHWVITCLGRPQITWVAALEMDDVGGGALTHAKGTMWYDILFAVISSLLVML